MITAVDLLRGLAALIGWDRIEVPGATGYSRHRLRRQGPLRDRGPRRRPISSASTSKPPTKPRTKADCRKKIKALEEIDRHIVGPLHAALKTHGDYRMLVSPDHPTPCRTKTHSHGFVPFAICGSGVQPAGRATYDEVAGGNSRSLVLTKAGELMRYFLRRDRLPLDL